MDLTIQVYGRIAKPVSEVFDAVHDPKKLSAYFTTNGASAPLDAGATVTWDFADFPGAFPVQVGDVERDRLIELRWQAGDGEYETRVRIEFEAVDAGTTTVRISETGWRETPEGLKSSYGNCMGWAQMIAFLKAWIEHGIVLRAGFYA